MRPGRVGCTGRPARSVRDGNGSAAAQPAPGQQSAQLSRYRQHPVHARFAGSGSRPDQSREGVRTTDHAPCHVMPRSVAPRQAPPNGNPRHAVRLLTAPPHSPPVTSRPPRRCLRPAHRRRRPVPLPVRHFRTDQVHMNRHHREHRPHRTATANHPLDRTTSSVPHPGLLVPGPVRARALNNPSPRRAKPQAGKHQSGKKESPIKEPGLRPRRGE
jgi:hypothetical protein